MYEALYHLQFHTDREFSLKVQDYKQLLQEISLTEKQEAVVGQGREIG